MSTSGMCDANEDGLNNSSQTLIQYQEQQPADHSLLPLLLKKLLLSGDETLQVTSAKCIAAILVRSPSQYCALCIKADLPGIESLVRSLKEALQLTNLEVPKQGFLLLTEILERQPPSIHLFPSGSGFVAVSEAVTAGVSSSCPLVAAQVVKAAAALFRLTHQSRPLQYQVVEELIEAITRRFSELTLSSPSHHRSTSSCTMFYYRCENRKQNVDLWRMT
ncbi:meiosis inhibitor protein 1-like [Girardinichthys multiradiatus]|uniref:meiosis inhibitor protein 1-like n=1 Tax=Girardinichthys multiradiatus TaxID=208333 RepID=UPI001FAD6DE3|nr:meiosis inhibitor protein 1-like [Girardinichthys multiradiatus]